MDREQRHTEHELDPEHELDRRQGESQQEYDQRIQAAADAAGQSRVEFEKAANERASRPAINRQDGDDNQGSGILS
jgi:hypothetical protein